MNVLKLKEFREKYNIERESQAEMLDVTIDTLNNWEYRTKKIPMHMAKHSFTDYAVKSDVGLLMISKLLGHTKLATTQHYLKDFYHKEESDTIKKLFG